MVKAYFKSIILLFFLLVISGCGTPAQYTEVSSDESNPNFDVINCTLETADTICLKAIEEGKPVDLILENGIIKFRMGQDGVLQQENAIIVYEDKDGNLMCKDGTIVEESYECIEPEALEIMGIKYSNSKEKYEEQTDDVEFEPVPQDLPLNVKSENSFYCKDVFEEIFLIGECSSFSNEYYILGVIENPNTYPVYGVKIYYTLYDEDGHVVGTGKRESLTINSIASKKDIPFIIVKSNVNNISSYKLNIQYDKKGYHQIYTDFRGKNIRIKEETSQPFIGGEIVNIGDKTANNIIIMVGLFDDSDNLVDLVKLTPVPDILHPGETGAFVKKEGYIPKDLEKMKDYKLWIQGKVAQ